MVVLVRALEFEVEGHRKKGGPKMAWMKLVNGENMKFGLSMKDVFC